MSRDRIQIDLNSPLAREREGVKLTERSLSSRLAEIIERLDTVVRHVAPQLTEPEWSLVLWAGWDSLCQTRVTERERPQDIDTLAWGAMVATVREAKAPWAAALASRLHSMGPAERIAVLERIEAYGRTEAL